MDKDAAAEVIETVDARSFGQEVLQGTGPIAVEFMSYSCSHCGAVERPLREVAESLRGSERIVRVNVVRDHQLAEHYAIEGTPTLVMFLDGEIVGRVEGPSPSARVLLEAVTRPFGP